MSKETSISVVLSLLLLCFGFTAWSQPATSAKGCPEEIDFSRWDSSGDEVLTRPGYGAWFNDGLLTVDINERKLDFVTREGKVLKAAGESLGVSIAEPMMIHQASSSQFLVADSRNRIHWLKGQGDQLVEDGEPLPTSNQKVDNNGTILWAIWDFVPFKESQAILAFGDIQEGVKVRDPIEAADANPEEYQDLLRAAFMVRRKDGSTDLFNWRLPLDHDAHAIYRRAEVRAVAILREEAYVLLLDETPRIGRANPGTMDIDFLTDVPVGYQKILRQDEEIRNQPGHRHSTMMHQRLEKSRHAMGLYVLDESLFLLVKEPSDELSGLTNWTLLPIDELTGAFGEPIPLPTYAPHLTLVPGETTAFIEVSKVIGVGKRYAPYMISGSMTLVPSSSLSAERLRDCNVSRN